MEKQKYEDIRGDGRLMLWQRGGADPEDVERQGRKVLSVLIVSTGNGTAKCKKSADERRFMTTQLERD